jgi:hypothetical protein
MNKYRVLFSLFLSASLLSLPWTGAPAGSRDGVAPPYPLKVLNPKGFKIFSGILDTTVVSESASVAFGCNYSSFRGTGSLVSFQLSKTGVCSSSRIFGSGMGAPRNAAALWIAASGSGPSGAGGYGLVYVIFEETHSNPQWSTLTVRVAKFGATGQRTSAWKEIWRTDTPSDTSPSGTSLFAYNRGDVIGVVFSLNIYKSSPQQILKSKAYFVEADIRDGRPTGNPTFLPVSGDGSFLECLVYRPAWNGAFWLVPAVANLYKNPGAWKDLYQTQALMFTVKGKAPHSAHLTLIDYDKSLQDYYCDLSLAPYPGAAKDQWLFYKTRTVIPKNEQKLEGYRQTYKLARIGAGGALVQTQKLSFGELVHTLVYDPAYIIYYDSDACAPVVASDATGTPQLFLSRIHTTDLYKKNSSNPPHRYEQQFLLYAINARTGAVTLKNRSVTQWANLDYNLYPVIFVFSSGGLAVVNTLRYMSYPYASLSTLSVFPDWIK